MKVRNIFILNIITLLIFTSCKREDIDLIVGTWEYSNIDFIIETNNPEATLALMESTNKMKGAISNITTTFTDSNKYSVNLSILLAGSFLKEGIYELKNGKLILDNAEEINYTLSKKKLDFTVSAKNFLGEEFSSLFEDYLSAYEGVNITKFDVALKFTKK